MSHIGLIGGIGPAATDYYYRRIIASFAARDVPLQLTMAHADTPTLLRNLERGDSPAQVQIYRALTQRLAAAAAVRPEQVDVFNAASDWLLRSARAEAILMGGTDLALVYREGETSFPILDCAAIHADAVVNHAVSG